MNIEFIKRLISSTILIPLSFLIVIKGSFFFSIFLFVIFSLSFYEWHKLSVNKNYYFPGIIFLFLSFMSVYFIRNYNEFGVIIFFFIISISILTDIGGYIFGKIFKGPKLTKISPNKTYAGMVGGYIFSLFFIFAVPFINDHFTVNNFWISLNKNLIVPILIFSSISQIGDLLISYCKRLAFVKDTGSIIPGHGGILDRIDGMLFTFPSMLIFYYI